MTDQHHNNCWQQRCKNRNFGIFLETYLKIWAKYVRLTVIPDGVILIPQRSPKIGRPCAMSLTFGLHLQQEVAEGEWELEIVWRDLDLWALVGEGKGGGAAGCCRVSLCCWQRFNDPVWRRVTLAFPLAGRHHHVLQQNSQHCARQSVTRQNTHTPLEENFSERSDFQIAVALLLLQTRCWKARMVIGELLLGSEVTRQVVASPPSLTNLISWAR